jgi:hypothetical protein
MSACVFIGPTLAPSDAAGMLQATYLPPARQGDVYRAVSLLRPRAIGIVDGYFQWVPSVWHKELLWAMHQGVHVFGAASMGALRAAELAAFGMRGVGRIFEAYRDGALPEAESEPFEDDDEVAVVHGPAESGYIAVSEAMVNVRCTLASAHASGVIGAATRARLANIAKALYFPERNYDLLLERGRAAALPVPELAALEAWLPSGRVNQKRADALTLLAAMRDFLAADPAPARAAFAFEHTTLWERTLAENAPATLHEPEDARVLDELRLQGERSEQLRRQVLQSLMDTASAGVAAEPALRAPGVTERHRQPEQLERLLQDAARAQAVRRTSDLIPAALVERQMLARLRGSEEFARLRARAEDKRACLAARRDLPEVEEFSGLQLLELRNWYFTQVLERDMPDEIEQCVRAWTYSDLAHFHRVIFSEFVYRQATGGDAAASAAAG